MINTRQKNQVSEKNIPVKSAKQSVFYAIDEARPLYFKILLVIMSFFLMVFVTIIFMNRTLSNNLLENVDETISDMRDIVSHTLLGPELALNFIADNMEKMFQRGESMETIKAYMDECSSQEFKNKIKMFDFYSVYGYFDALDTFYDGGGWTAADDFEPKKRPWYLSAVAGRGDVMISEPYTDADSSMPVIAYSRLMFDGDYQPIGVVSLDVPIDFIKQLILDTHITKDGYGFLLDEKLLIITHPFDDYLNKHLVEAYSGFLEIANELEKGAAVSSYRYINYLGQKSILFSKQAENGWFVNVVISENEYYRDMYYTAWIIGILGAIMAAFLSIILFRIDKAKNRSDIESRLKSDFLAHMSHEIRTPMNSIVGFSELALDDDISFKTKGYLLKILDNSKWLLQIINDILDISKVESGKMELEKIPFDMHELFASCRALVMPKAVEKGIMLHFYTEPSIGKRPLGDPTRLRQVLVNLLSNAIKFTKTGTVKVLAEIKEKSANNVTMYFEVKDSGIGMTDDQIKRIFDPFTQGETGTTRKYGGTGLGLAITRNIVELMGGKLSVESTPGIGSKFSFYIVFDTIDVPEDIKIAKKTALKEIEKPSFTGDVLLCEDNVMNQHVICEHLTRVGLKTIVADNGLMGVDFVRSRMEKNQKQFDLIFMDIHMPVMDGLEASEKIQELDPSIPIVAMTANIMANDMDLYKTSGMNNCVGKPFTSQELWRCLLNYFKPLNPEAANKDMPNNETLAELEQNFIKNLKLLFVRSNQNKFEEIVKALETDDIKQAYRLAHTLKGNAGQIGKTQLQQAAANIEHNLKNDQNLVTENQLTALKTELTAALAQLAEETSPACKDCQFYNSETKCEKQPLPDAEKTKELLEKLESLLQAGNPDCLNYISDINALPGDERLIQQLAQQVDDFKFEKAISILSELKSKLNINS